MVIRMAFSRFILPRWPRASHYLLLSLLFFAGLELITVFHQWISVGTILFLALVSYGIVLIRIEERHQFQLLQTTLPLLAAVGLTGFTLFLPTSALLHLYFALATLVFFWLLKHGAKLKYPTWNWALGTVIYLLDSAVILGLRFHLNTPVLLTVALIAGVTFLISLQGLTRVTDRRLTAILIAASLALVQAQLTWILQFLPLHFLVQAGCVMVTYYVSFHLLSTSFEHRLTWRDVLEYVLLGAVALGILLTTARWL